MTDHLGHRISRSRTGGDLTNDLVDLQGSDLSSVLMATMAARSESVDAAWVLGRYAVDRFVQPGVVPPASLRDTAATVMAHVPCDEIQLAPLVPFGTHAALGATPQDNVISTIRQTEVAADPTNALALEAARRRKDDPASRQAETDLAAVQRVTRAQRFAGPESYSHFTIAARVTAARVRPDWISDLAIRHISAWTDGIEACGLDVSVTVTDFSGDLARAVDAIAEATGARVDPDRTRGPDYYAPIAFALDVDGVDVGDGGFVDWGSALLSDAKDRMLISGLGLDRIALRRA